MIFILLGAAMLALGAWKLEGVVLFVQLLVSFALAGWALNILEKLL